MSVIRSKTGSAAVRAASEERERESRERESRRERESAAAALREPAVHGGHAGASREENRSDEDVARDKERAVADRIEVSRAEAVTILQDIGQQFVSLRHEGRSGAWASLEDKLALNAHVFISAGLMSPKDLIGMMTEIESFRKSEAGTQQAPGDFLAEWLNGEDAKPTKKRSAPVSDEAPGRSSKKKVA